jgi:hypothetical protein
MRIDCNDCGNELQVNTVSWPDYIDVMPCQHCIAREKEELIEDIENGRITLDEIGK